MNTIVLTCQTISNISAYKWIMLTAKKISNILILNINDYKFCSPVLCFAFFAAVVCHGLCFAKTFML